ncbi:MAG: entericidin [Akkermansia sp.]|nr:entericidin [Akkermansia sp.]
MKLRYTILTAVTLLACASCNTLRGVGKDVQSVGSDINSAASATSDALQ